MNKEIVVAEVAGKDSIAAIIKYAKENPGIEIWPLITKTPPEQEGTVESLYLYVVGYLREYISQYDVKVLNPHPIRIDPEWYELNRHISDTINNYGFYTPCIACHGLVHAVRIPYALCKALNENLSGKIITGERLSHNGKIKINQNKIVLEFYDKIFKDNNVEVIRPLENIHDTSEIDEIIKEFHDQYSLYDFKYPECYMSGNCKVITEKDLEQYKIKEYCEEYLLPKLQQIILEKQSEM